MAPTGHVSDGGHVTNNTCNSDHDTGPSWMTLLLGLNMGIQCFVGEVPMFFLSGNYHKNCRMSHNNFNGY